MILEVRLHDLFVKDELNTDSKFPLVVCTRRGDDAKKDLLERVCPMPYAAICRDYLSPVGSARVILLSPVIEWKRVTYQHTFTDHTNF